MLKAMNDEAFSQVPDTHLVAIDEAVTTFEKRWAAGNPLSIEEHLAAAPIPIEARSHLLRELIASEICLLGRAGETPTSADYLQRFPEAAGMLNELVLPQSDRDTASLTAEQTGGSFRAKSELSLSLPYEMGRYRLLKLLGRGGMGTVYLAHDTELDRRVALKMPEFGATSAAFRATINRFKREARAMANVSHPNLCQIYDVGEKDGRPYLTMAFIDGSSLSELIAAQRSFSVEEAVQIVLTLARAMQAVHRAGIVHRDLKPANVMVDCDQQLFITDFGLASRDAASEAELTHSGLILGSPAYMAPEQVNSQLDQIGPRTDVYALGVILYQLLTRRRPFEGAGLSVLGQISSGQRPLPPSKLADVGPRLEAICLKAMAHRIEDRYQSAAELAAALDEYASQPESRARRISRKRLATAVVLTSLVLVGLLVVRNRHADPGIGTLPAGPVSATVEESTIPAGEPVDSEVNDSLRSTAISNVWAPPVNLSELNGPVAEGSPTFSSDGSFVIFHRPHANGAPYHLWTASRLADGSGYGPPELLDSAVNSPETNTNPRLTSDGLTLVFDSDRPGGEGARDLWFSTRESLESRWSEARNFGPNVNSNQSDVCPFLSDDRLTLVFGSDRDGGYGGEDLWIATRKSADDIFNVPVNAGAQVNTQGPESHPWLSSDGLTLMFTAMRSEGFGGFDLWFSRRDSVLNEFGPPENAGLHVNSAEHEGHGSLSPDGTKLYFESTRPDGLGQYDIWMAEMATPTKRTAWPKDAPPPAVAPFD